MILMRVLRCNLLIGSSLTVLMMVLVMSCVTKAHQEYENFAMIPKKLFKDIVREKRSPCRSYGSGGGGGGGGLGGGGGGFPGIGTGGGTGGNGIGDNGIDLPIGGDADYLEIPVRRRGNYARRRNNRHRRTHNFKNNEIQEVQEEILTRSKRQAPDFGAGQMPNIGGQQMPAVGGGQAPDFGAGQMPNIGGQQMPGVGGAGGGLKDKIKEIGSKIKEIRSSVRQKIKEKIGQVGKH